MRIAALSDFHIGAHRHKDEFQHREGEFCAYLDRLEAEHDRIVLLGDIYQTDHGLIPGQRTKERQLARARQRLATLSARLEGPRYTYVHGNHDMIAGERMGALERLRIEADDYVAVFVHGHQFDPIFQGANALARAASWIMGRVRGVGLRPVAHWFESRDISIKHNRFGKPEGPYWRAGQALLRSEGANAVVMGHTHVAGRHELAEGLVLNTGSCSDGRRMHVTIDTVARTAELHRVA